MSCAGASRLVTLRSCPADSHSCSPYKYLGIFQVSWTLAITLKGSSQLLARLERTSFGRCQVKQNATPRTS